MDTKGVIPDHTIIPELETNDEALNKAEQIVQKTSSVQPVEEIDQQAVQESSQTEKAPQSKTIKENSIADLSVSCGDEADKVSKEFEGDAIITPAEQFKEESFGTSYPTEEREGSNPESSTRSQVEEIEERHLDLDESSSVPEVHKKAMEEKSYYVEDESDVTKQVGSSEKECLGSLELNEDRLNDTNKSPEETSNVDKNIDKKTPTANEHETAEAEKTEPEVKDQTSDTEVNIGVAEHCDEKTNLAPPEVTGLEETKSKGKSKRDFDASPENVILETADSHPDSEVEPSQEVAEAEKTDPEVEDQTNSMRPTAEVQSDIASSKGSLDDISEQKLEPSSTFLLTEHNMVDNPTDVSSLPLEVADESAAHVSTEVTEHCDEKTDVAPTVVTEATSLEEHESNEKALRALDASPEALEKKETNDNHQDSEANSTELGEGSHVVAQLPFLEDDKANNGISLQEEVGPSSATEQLEETETAHNKQQDAEDEDVKHGETMFKKYDTTVAEDVKAELFKEQTTEEKSSGQEQQIISEERGSVNNADLDITFIQSDQATPSTDGTKETETTTPTADHSQVPEASTSTKTVEEEASETAQKPEEMVHEINAVCTECSHEKAITAPTEASNSTKTVEEEAGETPQKPEETVHEINAEDTECSDEKAITAPTEASTSTKTVEEEASETAQRPEETVHEINAVATECSDEKAITAPTEASTSTETVEEEAGETAQKPEETVHEINAVGTECNDEKAITAPTEASTSTKTVEEEAGETAQKPEETVHEINAVATECSDEKAITAPIEASTLTKMVEEEAGETAQKPEETVHEINAEGTECSDEKAVAAPTEVSTSTKTVEEEAGETAQKPEETVHEINAEGTECIDEKAITAPTEASTSTKTVEEDAGETSQKPEETDHEINAEGTECSDEKTITAPTEVTRAISFGENKLIEEPATTSNEKPVSVFHASSEAMNTDTQETTDKCQDSEVDSMKLEETSSVVAQLPKHENEEATNGNNKETTSIEEEVQENVEASKTEPESELRVVDRARENEAENQNDLLETTDAVEDGVSMRKFDEDPEKKSGITFREPEESLVLEGKDAASTDTLTTEDKYEEDITVTGEDNVVDNQHQTSIHHEAQSEESSVPKTEAASFKTEKSSDATPDFETTASISELAGQVPEVSAGHDREDKKDDAASESSQTTESTIQEQVATDQASMDIASREIETDTDQVVKDHGLTSERPREISTECDMKEDTEEKQEEVDKQFQVDSTGEDTEKYITDGEHPTSNSTSLSTAEESDYVGQAYENRLNKFTEEESCTKSDETKTTDEEVINLAPSPSLEPTASDSSPIEKQMISEERGSINNADLDITFIQSDQVTAGTNGTKETETTPTADHSQVPEASASTKSVEEEAGEAAQKPVDISSSGMDASEETVREINAESTECSDEKTITAPSEVTRAISFGENKLIDETTTTSNEEPISVFHASSEAMSTDTLETTDKRQDSEVSSMKLDESSSVVAQLPKHGNEEADNGNNKETTLIEEVQENVEASKTEPESELRVVDMARENEAEIQNDLLETTDDVEARVSTSKIDEDPKKKAGITFREPEESVVEESKDTATTETSITEGTYQEDITVTGEDNVVDDQHQTSIHHEAQSEESSVPKTEAASIKTEKGSDATPDSETTASISELAGQVPEVSVVHDREDKKNDAADESSQTTESIIQEHVATDQAVSIDIPSRETETDTDQVVKDHGLNSEGPREISAECDTNEDTEQKQQEVDKQFQVDSTGEDTEKYIADEELPTSNSTSSSTAVEPDYVGQAYENRLNKSTEEESYTKSDGTKTTDEEVIDLAPTPSLEPTAYDSSEIESQIHKAAKDLNRAPEVPPSAKAVVEEPQNAAENPIQNSELMFETSDENVKELNVEVDEISESKDQIDTEIYETEVNLAEGEAGKKEINNQTEAPETILVGETGSSQIEEQSINKENVDLTAIKSDEATASTDATTEIDIAKAADLNLPPSASTLEKAPEKETEKPMEEHVNASSPWFGAALTGMYNYFKPEDKHQNEAQHEELSEESLTQNPEEASPVEGTACNTASETITSIKDPEPVEIPRSISHDTSEDAAVSDDIERNPTPEEENLSLKDVDEKTNRVDTEVFSKSGNDTNFDHPVIAKTVNVVGEKQNEASMSNLEGQVPEVFAVHKEEDKNDGETCGASKSTENTTLEDISYKQVASIDVASAKSEVEIDQLEKDHTQDVEHKKTAADKEIGLETRGDDIEKLITGEERGLYSTNVDAGEEKKTESSQEDATLSKITETEVLETNDETRHVDEIVQDKLTTQSAEPADDPKVIQSSKDEQPQVNVVIQAREVCEAAPATATIEQDYIGEFPNMTVEPKTGKDLTGANGGDSTISVEEGVEKTFGASYLTHEGQDSSQDVAKVNAEDDLVMNEVNEEEKDPERRKFSYGNVQESEDITTETEISKVAYLNPTSEASTLITVPEEETENAIEKPHDIPSSGLDTLGEKVHVENVELTEEGDKTTGVAPEIATEAISLEEDKSENAVEAFDINSDSISMHTLNTIDMNQDEEIDGIDREDTPSMVAQLPTHESEKPDGGITNIEEEATEAFLHEPINHGVEEVYKTSLVVGHTGVSETGKQIEEVPETLCQPINRDIGEVTETSSSIDVVDTDENETEKKIREAHDALSQPVHHAVEETHETVTSLTVSGADVNEKEKPAEEISEELSGPREPVAGAAVENETFEPTEVSDVTNMKEGELVGEHVKDLETPDTSKQDVKDESMKLEDSSISVTNIQRYEPEETGNEGITAEKSDGADVEAEDQDTVSEIQVQDVTETHERNTSPEDGEGDMNKIEKPIAEGFEALKVNDIPTSQTLHSEQTEKQIQVSSSTLLPYLDDKTTEIIEDVECSSTVHDNAEVASLEAAEETSCLESQLLITRSDSEDNTVRDKSNLDVEVKDITTRDAIPEISDVNVKEIHAETQTTELVESSGVVSHLPTQENEKRENKGTILEKSDTGDVETAETIPHAVVKDEKLSSDDVEVKDITASEEISGVVSHLPTHEHEKTNNGSLIEEKSDAVDVETAETIPEVVVKDKKSSSDDDEVKDIPPTSDAVPEVNSTGDEEIDAEVQSTKLVESSGVLSHRPMHEHEKTKNESLIEEKSDAVDVETAETIPEVVVNDKKSSSDDDEVKNIPPALDAVHEVNSTGDEEIDAEVQSMKLAEISGAVSYLPTHEHEKTENESQILQKPDPTDVETAETIPDALVKDEIPNSDDVEAIDTTSSAAIPEAGNVCVEEVVNAEVQSMKLAESSEMVSLPMNEHEITENDDIIVEKSDVAYIETAKTIPDAVVKDEWEKSDNAEVRNISTSDAIPAAGNIVEEIHPGVQSTNLVDSSSVESHLPKHEPEKTEIEIIIPEKSDVADIKTAETLEGAKAVTEIHETYTSPTLGETGMDEIEKQVDKVLETSRNVDNATRQTLHQEKINKQFPESSALFHPNQDSDITTTKEESSRVHKIGEVASLDPEETSRNESQLSETTREIANDASMEKVNPEDVQVKEVITPDAIPEFNKSGIEEKHERGASRTAESTGRDKNQKADLEESETADPGYQFDETDEMQTSYQTLPVIKLLEELQANKTKIITEERKDPTDMEVEQSSLKVTDTILPRSLATESEQALTSSTTEDADSNEVKAKEALSSEAGVEEVHEIEASPTAGWIEKDGSEEEKETATHTGKEEDHVTVTKFETTAAETRNTDEAGLYENVPDSFEKSATEEPHSQDKITRELQVTDFDVAESKDAAETELEGQNAARREPSLVENQTHIQTTEYADSPSQSEELIIQENESKEEGISDFQNQNSASENLLENTGEKFAQVPVSEISRSCILDSGEAEIKEPLKAAILEQSDLRDVSNHTNEISVGQATKQDEFNEENPVAINSGSPDEVPVPETKQEDDLGEENIRGRNSATTPEIQHEETFHESEKDGSYKSVIESITAGDQIVKDATQVLVGHSSDKTNLPGEGKDGENTSGGKDGENTSASKNIKLDLEDQRDETALRDKELEVPTIKEQVKESITALGDFEKLPEISNEDQGLQSISEGKVTGEKQVATNSDADSPSEENQLSLADPEVESGKAGQNTNDLDKKATQETTGQDVATGTEAPVTEVEKSEVMSRSNEDTDDKNKLSTELGEKQTAFSPIFGEHTAGKAHTEKVQAADPDANQDYTAAASYQEAEVQGLKSEAALAAEAEKEAPYEKDAVDKENKEQEEKNTTTLDSDGIQSTNKETQTVEPAVDTEEFQADTAEIAQVEAAKADEEEEGDEHNGTDSSFDSPVMVEASSKDIDVKTPHKKSHNILSGVGSKVKHSIAKVKKVITGKSPNPKTPPKEDKKQAVSPSAKTH